MPDAEFDFASFGEKIRSRAFKVKKITGKNRFFEKFTSLKFLKSKEISTYSGRLLDTDSEYVHVLSVNAKCGSYSIPKIPKFIEKF